ncbi:MAG TPA: ligase-associated DNA damage response DEXH box helicase [Caulobacteraceae bacterium]
MVQLTAAAETLPTLLPPRFASWFEGRGWSPRTHQLRMLQKARDGRHALLIAPTGGGKTLAGFLPSLVELAERGAANHPAGHGLHTLYISPLKALAVDVSRNLMAPIDEMGLKVRVESRTGDTGVSKRQRQKLHPPDILLTTPEQLALFCAWEGSRGYFEDLKTVIIDEIHAIHASKRGDLLSLGLARLQACAPALRRIGLSATVNDPDMLRRWLAPSQMSDLVLGEPGAPPIVDVLLSNGEVPWAGHTAQHAMAEVYQAIRGARTALVFVNTRWQAEFAFQELWRLNEDNLPIALHHGSLAAEQRRKVEAAMARGGLRAVVCTSTLDLGIDWGDVDLVIQLAAPKGSSRLVQRIGRANHRLDEPSRALLVPASRFEMLECQAAREAVAENALDGDPPRTGALDVLAQHVMGVACGDPFKADDLYGEVRTSAPYAALSRPDFDDVLEFVSTGGYALKSYDRFRRIIPGSDGRWRVRNAQTALRHRLNVGAITGPAVLNVKLMRGRRGGRKIGEVEEGYIDILLPGDTFIFGGQVWAYHGVEGNDVLVTPAPNSEPKMPSWGGSKFSISDFLARRVRQLASNEAAWPRLPDDVQEWLQIQKLRSAIPQEDELLVETFPLGKRWHLCAYPFEGRLAHTTLCMLLTRRLERLGCGPIGFVASDYALAVWSMRPMGGLDMAELLGEDMLGDDLEAWLEESVMMRRAFKTCALVSGLIERRFPGEEKTGRQVTFSSDLIYDVLRRHQPDHLLLRCARADAATGMVDVARLGQLLTRIKGRIVHNDLPKVSPFAVPILLTIGRESVPGMAQEWVLEQAESELIAEALS